MATATFTPNPNDDSEMWIERAAFENSAFRIWHLMFFCLSGFVSLGKLQTPTKTILSPRYQGQWCIQFSVVLVCCCARFRIPRTKQDIEADYMRKKLAKKFSERLRLIQNQDMDSLDLKKALDLVQQDYADEKLNIHLKVFDSRRPLVSIT